MFFIFAGFEINLIVCRPAVMMMIQVVCYYRKKHKHLMRRLFNASPERICQRVCTNACVVLSLSLSTSMYIIIWMHRPLRGPLRCCSWIDNLNDTFSHYSHHAYCAVYPYIFKACVLIYAIENLEYMYLEVATLWSVITP